MPPPAVALSGQENRHLWQSWQEGLRVKITLRADPVPLRMLLVMDNLAGHKTPELVLWLFDHGIMPLYTPLSGSWLNMAESMQRIIKRRALDCQHLETAEEIISVLEATVKGWNREPTPFEWGGKRAARRELGFRQQWILLANSKDVIYYSLKTKRRMIFYVFASRNYS